MKIVFLTPGTGSYYCGACMRDNALARELLRAGEDVTIAPMYLPHTLDEEALPGAARVPVFFGGINVYLQQKVPLFRRTPAFVDRLLNSTGLLRWAARHSHMTSARDHGEMTLEMFNVGSSRLGKELEKLMGWLEHAERPDVICLSTALLAGFAEPLKRRLGAPVVTFFQGEDTFLDGLPEPYRARCWQAMAATLRATDLLLSPSRFYADLMQSRLGLSVDAVRVVFNGIQLEGYATAVATPVVPTIGYLARMCREKGLEVMVDAFLQLAGPMGDRETRLHLAGAATAGDEPLIRRLRARIESAGLAARVTWSPNISREEKISFLRGLSLFSVPATYAEAFGLYVVEALACGVPVVQPKSAAFPELIAAGGGGVLVPPGDAAALARAWRDLLGDPSRRAELSRAGRASAENHFSSGAMAAAFRRELAGLKSSTSP